MNNRNLALDGIRGFAVLIVFLSHTSGREQSLSSLLQFQGIGHVGVYLFFVLSGYLLAYNLLGEYTRNGYICLKHFFIRRFLRIAPLYYLIVSGVYLNQQISGQITKKYLYIDGGFPEYIKHLVFYQGDGVFWTISAEFTFYLVLPFLVMLMIKLGDRALSFVSLLAFVFFIWGLLVILQILPSELAPKIVDIHHRSQFFEVFLCGVLAAFVEKNSIASDYLDKHQQRIVFGSLIAFVITIVLTLILVSYSFLGFDRPLYHFRWLSLFYGLVFGLIIVSSRYDGVLNNFFQTNLLRYMGVVGFSWYLIHFEVLQTVNELLTIPYQRFIMSFIICALVSGVLFWLVESPFIRLGKKLTTNKNHSSALNGKL